VTKDPDLSQYPAGSTVQLTAVPAPGWAFMGWSGDAAGSANPLSLTMDADKAATAAFADLVPPSVTVLAPNGGESLVVGSTAILRWDATDKAGVTAVDLLLSRYGPAGPYDSLAAGLANTGSYSWTVTAPTSPMVMLKARAHDVGGHTSEDASDATFSIVGTTAVEYLRGAPPTVLTLGPVQPNPMRDQARIAFGLPVGSRVRLQVLDLLGRVVATLADGELPPGRFAMDWDGRGAGQTAPTGMYFVRLQAGPRRLVRRLVLTH
jgi:hypothetical protein